MSYHTYEEMEKAHQEEVNQFPITWIFGHKSADEIKDALAEIGAASLEECVSISGGGIIRKCDVKAFVEMFDRHKKERAAFAENEKGLYEMILHEMRNCEYGYTNDKSDTLLALGRTEDDLKNDSMFCKAWKKAEDTCFKE